MKYFSISYPGVKHNEDYAFVCKDYGFVLDGTTGLCSQKISDAGSDAEWFSHAFGEYLKEHLKDTDKSIFNILKAGIKEICPKFKNLKPEAVIEEFPSCTVSIARIKGDKVEFFVLGDSPIIVKNIFGDCFEIKDIRNNINDCIVLSKLKQIAKQENITLLDARHTHADVIKENRILKNSKGHQYILNDDEFAVDSAICFEMDKALINKILLMTDGFSQVYDTISLMSMEELANSINSEHNAAEIYYELREIQSQDAKCEKYARFKESDDTTLVYFELN